MEAQFLLYLCLVLLITVVLQKIPTTFGSDPDPLQDLCVADLKASSPTVNGFPCKPPSDVVADDFFFDGLTKEADTNTTFGSTTTRAAVFEFPGLNTLGLSTARVDFAPGGINAPHTHPRASELILVLKGELLMSFVTQDNKLYSKRVKRGEVFVVPRGLTHFQQNVGKGKATTFVAFNSQFPGGITDSTNLFGAKPAIPDQVLAKAFQLDEVIVKILKHKLSS